MAVAWTDKPTEAQIGLVYKYIRWHMPNDMASKAASWLENNADRRVVSKEIKRLKELRDKRLLDRNKCFESDIWEGFEHE